MSQSFIVVFKEKVTKDQINKYADEINANGGEVTHRYDSALNGFAAKLTDDQLQGFKSLQSGEDDIIDFIEADSVVTTQ